MFHAIPLSPYWTNCIRHSSRLNHGLFGHRLLGFCLFADIFLAEFCLRILRDFYFDLHKICYKIYANLNSWDFKVSCRLNRLTL